MIVEILLPALEAQPGLVDQLQALLDREGAIGGVQEGVDEAGVVPQVLDRAHIVAHQVILLEVGQGLADERDVGLGLAEPEAAEQLLQHIDAGAEIAAVDHHADHAVGRQAAAELGQRRGRVGQVMQHAGGDDHVERLVEPVELIDRHLLERQVVERVFAFEQPLMVEARDADIDAEHARLRVALGDVGGLVGAAARHQDAHAGPVGPIGPIGVMQLQQAGIAGLPHAPQADGGLGIDPARILVLDRIGHLRRPPLCFGATLARRAKALSRAAMPLVSARRQRQSGRQGRCRMR